MNDSNKYCNSLTTYSRFLTREVKIGNIPLGGLYPIRIQSMTTTDTMNTIATVEQTIRMVESGCEYVRITAPSINEAKNLKNIKDELKKRGCEVPLIADIHFTPNAAEEAARIIEKVRVNPGNYIDKKKFQQIEYTDIEYEAEIERIRKRFSPLVKICKEYGTAMRIGTNHGSLSDRIMSRYGDTPLGMVESALEFVRICEDLDYHDIVLSMKASNTQVMVQAYRLLVNKMLSEGMNYPLHLGVTEAGDGEDGRIKSAVGIGTLLEDGLGDTIRVSLTEEPEFEAPVAIALAKRYKNRSTQAEIKSIETLPYDPFSYLKIPSYPIKNFGDKNSPRVIADLSNSEITNTTLASLGLKYLPDLDKWNIGDQAPDYIFAGEKPVNSNLPESADIILNYETWLQNKDNHKIHPLFKFEQYLSTETKSLGLNFVAIDIDYVTSENFEQVKNDLKIVFVLETKNNHGLAEQRRVFIELQNQGFQQPVVIKRNYQTNDLDEFRIYLATDLGGLFVDGFGDGVWVENSNINPVEINRILFGILQAARVRISKTEYIACPSCGRTLFDLVEVTNKIRERTGHLKGVKIGIMGCIVNGPGEMADADYGYVGSGPGKITLYRGKDVIKKSVPSETAVDGLIDLIKEDGIWIEPTQS
ncbi:MAG: (E)-4-hydroxy-3-methylbut-2-enyl-diphosphate synthase [Ignavibacteriae bacterium]|nr:(E)-4-hydroxy-3-methylbut-2-enyl-diphosphate synthase [Ignavibacteriota bacterium]MCB9258934.1 (E)-4-hydroxy-3-methylbut-2-enyl-diphosphate synthase [Ignavibacteriales bacterium]